MFPRDLYTLRTRFRLFNAEIIEHVDSGRCRPPGNVPFPRLVSRLPVLSPFSSVATIPFSIDNYPITISTASQ